MLSSGVFSLDIEDTTRTIANLGQPEQRLAKTADTMLRETSKATGTSASLPIEGVAAPPLPMSRLAQCGTPRKMPSEVGNYLTTDVLQQFTLITTYLLKLFCLCDNIDLGCCGSLIVVLLLASMS